MKKNKDKNYTLYWMALISAVLTIPIALIIMNKVQVQNVVKAVMITAVFLVLLIAITILYKSIFGVTVKEITQEEKVTGLDRLSWRLTEFHRQHRNVQLIKCIEAALEQLKIFKRRKDVMYQVAGEFNSDDSGGISDLVQTVEDALAANTDRIVNRIEIFDDQGIFDIQRQNINYIEELLNKNNEILMEFENLITETSRIGEASEEKDISKLRDVVNAMKSLRTGQEDEIDALTKKYDRERTK
jgi:hypothetical protein